MKAIIQKNHQLICGALLVLCVATLFAQDVSLDVAIPATPNEFHEQELNRIVARLQAAPISPLLETQADFDVIYYELDLDLRDFAGETIQGFSVTKARSLVDEFNEMILDLCDDLIVDSVWSGGVAVSYSQSTNQLIVVLDRAYAIDEIVEVKTFYHGTPCQTSSFVSFQFWKRPVAGDSIPTIATLSEPYGARDWWPCKDSPNDKADSARISMTVADTITATSNGLQISVTSVLPSSQKFTWFEKHPIASYLICMSATNYAMWREWYVAQNGDSMPIDNYSFPEKLTQAQSSWNITPAVIDFLSETFGEYPFVDEKYGHTMFGVISGAMEHQCNTSYGHTITTGSHTFDYVVVHEAGHQWWGDHVTLDSWPNIWLNEGFATYCEALWKEHIGGGAAYRSYMTSVSGLRVMDPSGPVYDPSLLFSKNSVYNKGAWILHMLRGVIRNDSLFFAALSEYRNRHAGSTATTEDFLADVSDVAGYDVTPYVYAYLYLVNRPTFQYGYGNGTVDGVMRTVVRVKQVQIDPDTTFNTRLDLKFSGAADTTVTVENFNRLHKYIFEFDGTPETLTLDPDNWVLKTYQAVALDPTIINSSLSTGEQDQPYLDTLIAIGGTLPFTWSLIGGELPDGLLLSSFGVISGVADSAGDAEITVRVEDSGALADTMSFSNHIRPPLFAPEEPTCFVNDSGFVELRWRSVADVIQYEVYRATVGSFADSVHVATTTDTLYTESPLIEFEDVRFYVVRAVR